MSPLTQPRYTPEEYLALEREADHRSEYVNGRIYALAGASRAHNLIMLNLAAELRAQLRERQCEVYASDMRVKVEETGLYTYPDVVAVCGEARFEDAREDTLLNPAVVVEVLSESTERYDRGEKFAHYRRVATLSEYVLIAQDKLRAELFVRDGDQWILSEIGDGDGVLILPSLGSSVSLQDIYRRVEFSADQSE